MPKVKDAGGDDRRRPRDGKEYPKKTQTPKRVKGRNKDGGVGTYPIGNGATHTGDHGDTTAVPKANHLLGHSLSGHEHARDINLEHGVAVFGRVLERRGLLLDTGGSNQTIHPALCVGDALDDVVQQFCVTHVDATVL